MTSALACSAAAALARAAAAARVLDRALDELIRQLEQSKFAATGKPCPGRRRPVAGKRYVPAEVKRAVWERDQGRCTFVSETGHRCPARTLLEFDHGDPVARGGRSTVEWIRLRCRAHNQYAAECAFGNEFMSHKRQEAQLGHIPRGNLMAQQLLGVAQLVVGVL